jgi:hypothetical protein
VNADSVAIARGSITASTSRSGDAGNILVNGGSLVIEDGVIDVSTLGRGDAGQIDIDAGSVQIHRFGAILANSRSAGIADGGKAGTIEVTAAASILLDHEDGPPFSLRAATGGSPRLTGIFSATGGGDGGSIRLHAPDITVTNGAIVASSTVSGGAGGDVVVSGDRIHILNGASWTPRAWPVPEDSPLILSDPLGAGDGRGRRRVAIRDWRLLDSAGCRPPFVA